MTGGNANDAAAGGGGTQGRAAGFGGFGNRDPRDRIWALWRVVRDRIFFGLCITVALLTVTLLAVLLLSVFIGGLPRLSRINLAAWRGEAVPVEIGNLYVNVPFEAMAISADGPAAADIAYAVPPEALTDELSAVATPQAHAEYAQARRLAAQAGLSLVQPVSTPRALNPLTPQRLAVVQEIDAALVPQYRYDIEAEEVVIPEELLEPPGFFSRIWRYTDLGHFLSHGPSRFAWAAGLMPALWGSIMICLVCGMFGLPLGVATAIFLEEFRPKHRVLRRVHSFVAINIRNLAGVPSIVYGILGLTIFVQMFGWFGNQNDPAWEIGVEYYDQFLDAGDHLLRVPVPARQAPVIEITEGMTALYQGRPVEVVFYTFDTIQQAPTTAAGVPAPGSMIAELAREIPPQRAGEKAWWYLRIPFGRSVLAGGLTLMLVVLPIVIIAASEALRGVPNSLREGALAAGATRWQMVRRMTLPAAVPGIMTGSILAMSRAIGEAAPILVIAGIVFILFRPQNLMDDFTAMPLQIFNWAGRPEEDLHKVASSGIIILLAILLAFNALAVFIRQKFQKPLQ